MAAFRKVLTSLLDSLEATVRVARWSGPEAIPTPLKNSESKLLDHLDSANRFAADRYVGSPQVVACMTAMIAADPHRCVSGRVFVAPRLRRRAAAFHPAGTLAGELEPE